MKRSSNISLLLLLLLAVSAHAQLAWHKGEVMPATGIRLWGELCYQPRANALLFRQAKEADTWRTYPADQLRHFSYVTPTGLHYFATYDVPLSTGATRAMLFQELIPGASVALLQLADTDGSYRKAKQGLPRNPKAAWQTPQLWYVWLDGRLLAPDVFVETELDSLLATTPPSVQRWAKRYPRPTDPKSLARWLAYFDREMHSAHPALPASPTIVSRRYAH